MKIEKCISKVLSEDKEYLEEVFKAVTFKEQRIAYHVKTAQEKYDAIFQKSIVSINNHIVDLNNVSFELEAMIDVLNSMPDIGAQIVNLVVLSSVLSKRTVSIYKVRDNLAASAQNLKSVISKWVDSDEFRYVRVFCNINKHRSLIDRDYFTKIDYKDKLHKQGIRFYAFAHDGIPYSEKMMSEIFVIKDTFMDMFWDVIEEMEKLV